VQTGAGGDQQPTTPSPTAGLSQPTDSVDLQQPANQAMATWQAKILPQGLDALPATPLIIPIFEGKVPWKCHIDHIFKNGNVIYHVEPGDILGPPDVSAGIPDDCRVTVRLEGYATVDVTLHHQAVVALRRLGARNGSLVSASSLEAPEPARKAYEKGMDEIDRKKWDKARLDLERAVALWPKYAAAWTDLGEVYREQSMQSEARGAYEHALQADPKYARGYVPAARLALDEGRMNDGLRLSEQAIAIDPVEFPEAWFYSGVANFNLKHFDEAARSAQRAIELDASHALLPRAEHLLGFIFTEKHQYAEALVHLRNYVRISPMATDVPETISLIATLEQMSAPRGAKDSSN
jgi:tetratricopeptide (TPR) repeat protein